MHRYVNLKEIGEQKLVGGILPRLTRRQQQQTVPNNLRASLRSHGHGMSLVNVNTEQSHGIDITPDYHEHILQQFGLFTNGLSTRVALNAQEKKAEERHRKQVLGFAFRVICNTQLLFAIVSYIAVTAVIVHVQAIRESAFVEWLSASHSGMAILLRVCWVYIGIPNTNMLQ